MIETLAWTSVFGFVKPFILDYGKGVVKDYLKDFVKDQKSLWSKKNDDGKYFQKAFVPIYVDAVDTIFESWKSSPQNQDLIRDLTPLIERLKEKENVFLVFKTPEETTDEMVLEFLLAESIHEDEQVKKFNELTNQSIIVPIQEIIQRCATVNSGRKNEIESGGKGRKQF